MKLSREDLIKLFAIVVVLFFLIEYIPYSAAANFINSIFGGGRAEIEIVRGIAIANVTIEGFEEELVVSGNSSLLKEAKKKLISEKLALYAAPKDERTWVFALSSRKNLKNASREMRRMGLDVYGIAFFTFTEPVVVKTMRGEVSARGFDFQRQISPELEVGDKIRMRFEASVQVNRRTNFSQITEMKNIEILPEKKSNLSGTAEVLNVSESTFIVSIPWEQRRINRSEIKEEFVQKFNASFRYSERSFLSAKKLLTFEQIEKIEGLKLPYITAVSKESVSIRTNFTNKSALLSDLGNYSALFDFPNSTIQLGFGKIENRSEVENGIKEIMEKFNVSYGITHYASLTLELPEELKGDRDYYVKERIVNTTLPGDYKVGDKVNISVDASTLSTLILRVDYLHLK